MILLPVIEPEPQANEATRAYIAAATNAMLFLLRTVQRRC